MKPNVKSIIANILLCLIFIVGCSQKTSIEPTKAGYVMVDDGKLFYQQFGEGPPMLVLHGGPGLDQSYLLPQMLALAEDHEMIFYDQRGSGKSLDTLMDASHINLEQFTKDVDAVRQAVGHDKITLVGHSFGGRLAMSYALQYPEHVSQLILLNSAPADYKGQQAFFTEVAIKTKPIENKLVALSDQAIFNNLSADEIHTLFRDLFSVFFYNPKEASKLTLNMSQESARSGERVRAMLPWHTPEFSILAKLEALKVPTLIIHGSADVIPEWTAHDLNKAISNSDLYVMQDCGHFPYIEKPDEFFAKIRNFEVGKK